jgi:hypothetical protein
MQIESSNNSPPHSDQLSLEVALLRSSALDESLRPVTMVVAAEGDIREYLTDSLNAGSLEVVAVDSTAAALDEASRCSPRLLVVTHGERGVVRHFPAVAALLLSNDSPAAETTESRLAPLIILREAVGAQRLIEVTNSLLAWNKGGITYVASDVTNVAEVKETTSAAKTGNGADT